MIKSAFVENTLNQSCCVCYETPSRVYRCNNCRDGVVCIDCHKNISKLDNVEKIIIYVYHCPICRQRGKLEDLDNELLTKYELDHTFILEKIMELNDQNIFEFQMNYESSDDEAEEYSMEEIINDSLLAILPKIDGLTPEKLYSQKLKQLRFIDIIKNVYYLDDLFG